MKASALNKVMFIPGASDVSSASLDCWGETAGPVSQPVIKRAASAARGGSSLTIERFSKIISFITEFRLVRNKRVLLVT